MANCNIVVRKNSGIVTMTQGEINKELDNDVYDASMWKNLMGGKFPDLKVINSRKVKIDNQPAQFAIFELDYESTMMKVYSKSIIIITATPGCFGF